MTQKKNYLLTIALALCLSLIMTIMLVIPTKGHSTTTVQDEEPYRVERFSQPGGGMLDVRTSGGHITVRGSDTDETRVEMYVQRGGDYLTPEDTGLEEYEIDISQSADRVTASAESERENDWRFWRNDNISISFVVYTPRAMESTLRTSGGHIEVTGLKGTQELRTSGGHLELGELQGTVAARTSGGHISIDGFEGDLEARTSGGHINTRNANGTIHLRTSGGHIELARVSGTIEASTSGGSIEADITSITESVELRTSGGHVTVSVPGGVGYDLELRGSRVRSDLSNFSGQLERDEVEGTVNGGGARLFARTSGGTVRLNFH